MTNGELMDCQQGTEKEVYAFMKCIWRCEFWRNGCDGPRLSAYPTSAWCIAISEMMKRLDVSVNQLADGAGISRKTASAIKNGSIGDNVGRETARLVENYLTGSDGKWPCGMELAQGKEIVYQDRPETLQIIEEKNEQIQNLRQNVEDAKAEADKVRADKNNEIHRLHVDLDAYRELVGSMTRSTEEHSLIIHKLMDNVFAKM